MLATNSELVEEWGSSEKRAVTYLVNRGYKLTKSYNWIHPNNIDLSEKDIRAMSFLIYEWDYGGYQKGIS